jgi:hypothetical protein
MLVVKAALCGWFVGADPNDNRVVGCQVGGSVTQVARLCGATGRVRLRVEEEDDSMPPEVFDRDLVAVLVEQRRTGCFVAYFKHEWIPLENFQERSGRRQPAGRFDCEF